MRLEQNCKILLELAIRSNGRIITLPSGKEGSFKQLKKYSINEIEEYETENQVTLPASYKKFLNMLGSIECYLDDGGLGLSFISLKTSQSLIEEHYSDYLETCPQFFIAVENNLFGDVGGFNLEDGKFTIIPSDESPEDWFENDSNWVDFEEWLDILVKTSGEDYII